jgi:hypothetical protein
MRWFWKIHEYRAIAVRRTWRFTGRHIGHRGAVMAFLAFLDLVYGYSLSAEPGPLKGVNLALSLRAWSIAWILAGVFMATGISTRKDKAHYAVAVFLLFGWAVALFRSWLYGEYARGWVSALIWSGFAILIFIISSWPEGYVKKVSLDKKADGEE